MDNINVIEIFDDLYAEELNHDISVFWDAGYRVRLGDELNKILSDDTVSTYLQAVECLRDAAIEHYPDSDFAKKYG